MSTTNEVVSEKTVELLKKEKNRAKNQKRKAKAKTTALATKSGLSLTAIMASKPEIGSMSLSYTPGFQAFGAGDKKVSLETKQQIDKKNEQEVTPESIKGKLLSVYNESLIHRQFIEELLKENSEALCAHIFPNLYKILQPHQKYKTLFKMLCDERIKCYKAICEAVTSIIKTLEQKIKRKNDDVFCEEYVSQYYDLLRWKKGIFEKIDEDNLKFYSKIFPIECHEHLKRDYSNVHLAVEQFDFLLNQIRPLIEERQIALWSYSTFTSRNQQLNEETDYSRIVKISEYVKKYENDLNDFRLQLFTEQLKTHQTIKLDYIDECLRHCEADAKDMDNIFKERNKKNEPSSTLLELSNDNVVRTIALDAKTQSEFPKPMPGKNLLKSDEESTNALFYSIYDLCQKLKHKRQEFDAVCHLLYFLKVEMKSEHSEHPVDSVKLLNVSDMNQNSDDTSEVAIPVRKQEISFSKEATKDKPDASKGKVFQTLKVSGIDLKVLEDNSKVLEGEVKIAKESSKQYPEKSSDDAEKSLEVEEFRRQKSEKSKEYHQKVEEERLKKKVMRRNFVDSMQSSNVNVTDFSLVEKMRKNLLLLEPSVHSQIVDVFTKECEFSASELNTLLKKLGFIPRKTDYGYNVSFGSLSFSYHFSHQKDQRGGKPEVPLEAIRHFKKILVNLGVSKKILLEMKSENMLKEKFLASVVTEDATSFLQKTIKHNM